MLRVNSTEIRFNFWINKAEIEGDNETREVVLADIPWKIKISNQSDGNEKVIKVSLIGSAPANVGDSDWFCEAMAKISPLFSKANCNETIVPTTKFSKYCLSSDSVDLIRYADSTDFDLTQYEHNERIMFDVHLLVNPTKYFTSSVLDQTHTTFRYTVENVSQSGRKISPELTLSGSSWYISLRKIEEKGGKEASLALYLYNKRDERNNWVWPTNTSFRLLSFDENIPPMTRQLSCDFYLDSGNRGYSNFVDWNTLMDPTKKYVQNDTAIFEIDLKVELPKPLTDFKQNSMKRDAFECSICLHTIIGRDPVATKCGHLFCKACISRSIRDNKPCPNCNADVDLSDIRKLYL